MKLLTVRQKHVPGDHNGLIWYILPLTMTHLVVWRNDLPLGIRDAVGADPELDVVVAAFAAVEPEPVDDLLHPDEDAKGDLEPVLQNSLRVTSKYVGSLFFSCHSLYCTTSFCNNFFQTYAKNSANQFLTPCLNR